MVLRERYTTVQLLRRSLLPSSTSGLLCACFSIILIAVHCLLLSVSAGTALPDLFDGQWATAYTNTVVRPIDVLFANLTFNSVLTMLMWGAAGLAVYSVGEFLIHLYRDGREAAHDVQLAGRYIIRHPVRREFFVRLIWRASVLLVALALFVAVHPLPERLLAVDGKLIVGAFSLAASAWRLAFAIVAWTVLAHCFVVFLRLFLMRTRLFGDEDIE